MNVDVAFQCMLVSVDVLDSPVYAGLRGCGSPVNVAVHCTYYAIVYMYVAFKVRGE